MYLHVPQYKHQNPMNSPPPHPPVHCPPPHSPVHCPLNPSPCALPPPWKFGMINNLMQKDVNSYNPNGLNPGVSVIDLS